MTTLTEEERDEIARHLPQQTLDMLELFEYKHLPEHLQEVSRQFHDLAWRMSRLLTQRPAEKATCLRKLLEGKDAAVRMVVPLGRIGSNSPPLSGA